MKTVSLIVNWLILSSKDSKKISTTAIGSVIFTLLSILVGHFSIDASELAGNVDEIALTLGQLLSISMALIGMFRKLKLTVKGQNAVLNDPMI